MLDRFTENAVSHFKSNFARRNDYRLKMFENRVLGRISGPKREKVGGGKRKLHSEELHNLFSSPNIISVMKSRR